MKSCIYVQYFTHDGQPVWGPLLAERMEYTFQLGSQGPGTMSHFTPSSLPTLSRDIVAPKRNDYKVKWTNDDGLTFVDVQGGFLWDAALNDNDFGVAFAGVDWSAWLDNPFPQDREVTQAELLADSDLLTSMYIGLPTSPYDWVNGGVGVNQQIIITDMITALNLEGANAPVLALSFTGSHWINVPETIGGNPGGGFFTIGPFDTSSIRQHISSISTLNDPWVPNFRTFPDRTLEFFFLKNKDPDGDIIPDFAAHDENVIHKIDWTEHGPIATYVTGFGIGNFPIQYTTRHLPSEQKFRRWRSSHTIGTRGQVYLTREQVEEGTKAFADKYPQKDLTMTIYPDKLDPYDPLVGFTNLCGKILDVNYDFPPFHAVDAIFYIISQHFHADVAGNWLCDLGLQQIYTS